MALDGYQILSLAGAALILTAYAASQFGYMKQASVSYQALNLFGGAALCITAVETRQYGFIILEGAWTLLSGAGILKILRRA